MLSITLFINLASVKSNVAALRSTLTDKTHKKPRALSWRTADLLSQLDSVQSSDPMIREGKRSIAKELVKVSAFIDKWLIRESEEDARHRGKTVSSLKTADADKVLDEMSDRVSEEEDEAYLQGVSHGEEIPKVARHREVHRQCLGLAPPLPVKLVP